MRLADMRPGDRVEVDVRGAVFAAQIKSIEPDGVWIVPASSGYGYRRVTARQIRRRLTGGLA